MKLDLTEAKIRTLPLGSGVYWDDRVKGLAVICHKTCRSFVAQTDLRRNKRHVRSIRVKIDRCDRMSLSEARRRAKAILSDIQSGRDPTAGPEESGITVREALEAHLAERKLRSATEVSYRYNVDRYMKGLASRAVADITRGDVRELAERLKRNHGPNASAGTLRTLRAIINSAQRYDATITSNPVEAVRIPPNARRVVQQLDVAAFWAATEARTPIMRDAQRTVLLTGARRSSLVNVRRDDVDLDRRTITFRHMKTSDGLVFPIGRWLAEMLAARMKEDEPLGSPWLWPSRDAESGHLMEPKRKGLPSPHALRHAARTMMVEAGVPFSEASLLVGHRLPGVASIYVHQAHLVEHLRPYAQALEDLILSKAMPDETPAAIAAPVEAASDA